MYFEKKKKLEDLLQESFGGCRFTAWVIDTKHDGKVRVCLACWRWIWKTFEVMYHCQMIHHLIQNYRRFKESFKIVLKKQVYVLKGLKINFSRQKVEVDKKITI